MAVEKPANFYPPNEGGFSSKENNLLFHVRDYLNQYVYALIVLIDQYPGLSYLVKKMKMSRLTKSLASRHLQEKSLACTWEKFL